MEELWNNEEWWNDNQRSGMDQRGTVEQRTVKRRGIFFHLFYTIQKTPTRLRGHETTRLVYDSENTDKVSRAQIDSEVGATRAASFDPRYRLPAKTISLSMYGRLWLQF